MTAIDARAVRKLMDRAPMTPTQLANEIQLSLTYTCRIVNGTVNLRRSPEIRHRIAAALDVPVHWIETRDEQEVA